MKTDSNFPTLGKYGRMRRTYLKEHKTILFNQMLLNDTLWLHLCEVDKDAFDLFQTIVEQMANSTWRTMNFEHRFLKASVEIRVPLFSSFSIEFKCCLACFRRLCYNQ